MRDLTTGSKTCIFRQRDFEQESIVYQKVRFSPDGCAFALGRQDGCIEIRDTKTSKLLQTLEADYWATSSESKCYLQDIAFSKGGGRLAATYWRHRVDNEIHLWEVRTGNKMCNLKVEFSGSIEFIRYLEDGTGFSTNAGIIRLDAGHSECDVQSIQLEEIRNTLYVANHELLRDPWLKCGSQNIIWLPVDYRSYWSVVHVNTAAIPLDSRTIKFLKIDFERYNAAYPSASQVNGHSV